MTSMLIYSYNGDLFVNDISDFIVKIYIICILLLLTVEIKNYILLANYKKNCLC